MRRYKSLFIAIGAFVAYYIVIGFVMKQSTCIFRNTTGIPCPGCGMTRSYIHLLHGDIAGAFEMHPLFWLVPILACLAGSDYIIRRGNYTIAKPLRLFLKGGIALCLLLFVGVYIYRMVVFFPHTEPMTLNHQALWPQVIHWMIH